MRRLNILFVLAILMISTASAEIIISQQPKTLYNIGDTIEIPIKIIAMNDLKGNFKVNLLCNSDETEVYKAGIELKIGEEKTITPLIILDKNEIENLAGTCKIKAELKTEYVLSNNFVVSELIVINLKEQKTNFNPNETIFIEGDAKKENGDLVLGLVNIEVSNEDSSNIISVQDSVANGQFKVNLTLPGNLKAGQHTIKINIYEKDSEGGILNNGDLNYNILINQVATSLGIIFENKTIEPGKSLKVKAILYDQSNEKMSSNVILSIKNSDGKILQQIDKPTDEFLSYSFSSTEAPAKWSVVAASNKISAEDNFIILEKKDAKIEVINNTLVITNLGNVVYDKEIIVKIGEETRYVNTSIEVGKKEEYVLTAPDGEYQIEVISDGKSVTTSTVMLTGNVIDIKKTTGEIVEFARHPVVWVFVLIIVGLGIFFIFKKKSKKKSDNFGSFGKESFHHTASSLRPVHHKMHKENENQKHNQTRTKQMPVERSIVIPEKNRAEISSSIKGESQDSGIVCLNIKNFSHIDTKTGSPGETIQKIISDAENKGAIIYETRDFLFFILSPVKTKSSNNEPKAIELAQSIRRIINEHNKTFKERIIFGIAVNSGTMIVKPEKDSFKFMSLGMTLPETKRIASFSKGEIYLGERIKEKMPNEIKGERREQDGKKFYVLTEVRNLAEHEKFINSFMKRNR